MDSMYRPRLRHAAVALGLAATLLLAAASVRAAASNSSSVGVASDGSTSQVRRSVVWVGYPAEAPKAFRIDSASLNAPSPDDFQITYSGGAFTLEYERVAGGPVTSSFSVTVQGVVEWFGAGEGEVNDSAILSYLPLGAAGFGDLPVQHTQTTTSDGVVVHTFLVQDNSQDIQLNLTIADGFVQMAPGVQLTPMEAELTLGLRYSMAPTATHLALQLGLISSASQNQKFSLTNQTWDETNHFSSNQRAVNVSNEVAGGVSSAFFAWSNSATVDGQPISVNYLGPIPNGTTGGYDLYLSYPHLVSGSTPSEVVVEHDPSLGVVSVAYQSIVCCNVGPISSPGIQGDLTLYAVSMAAVAGLVAGTALVVARRRRQS